MGQMLTVRSLVFKNIFYTSITMNFETFTRSFERHAVKQDHQTTAYIYVLLIERTHKLNGISYEKKYT